MERVNLLILACSTRPGGRCLAGVDVATNEWVRPISSVADAALRLNYWPPVGEIWNVPLVERHSRAWQPENYLIGEEPWTLTARPSPTELLEHLESLIVADEALFGGYGETVSQTECQRQPRAASLTLVEPLNLRWEVTHDHRGRHRVRALFSLGGATYDLVVTDPDWKEKFRALEEGVHDGALGEAADRTLLTVSLGEPFKGTCYKLVAAVIQIQRP